jgi:hypothetical protein
MTFGLLHVLNNIFIGRRYWNVPFGEFALPLVSGMCSLVTSNELFNAAIIFQILSLYINCLI